VRPAIRQSFLYWRVERANERPFDLPVVKPCPPPCALRIGSKCCGSAKRLFVPGETTRLPRHRRCANTRRAPSAASRRSPMIMPQGRRPSLSDRYKKTSCPQKPHKLTQIIRPAASAGITFKIRPNNATSLMRSSKRSGTRGRVKEARRRRRRCCCIFLWSDGTLCGNARQQWNVSSKE
jgi:hypothetical protein